MRALVAWVCCIGAVLAGCGTSSGPQTGGHTHWLLSCQSDAQCGDDLQCICGRCVAPCATPGSACSAPVAGTSCFPADGAVAAELCGGDAAAVPLCLATCTGDAECGDGRCVGGACLPAPVVPGTGGTAGIGGTAGTGGAGNTAGSGAGGSGAGGATCGPLICAAGEVCCGVDECRHCISALSGANCPDTCSVGTGGAGGSCADANYALPDLDRTCTTASDCFLGLHWTDCCGSQAAVAFAQTAAADFVAYETPCGPSCACPSSATLADDGSVVNVLSDVVADCVDGRCLARGAQYAGTCLDAETCIDTEAEGACGAAPGPLGAGICRGAAGICFLCECAAPDTPIATPTGDRPIAELQVGDLVYSVEGAAIVVVPIARVNARRVEGHRVVEVRLENDTVLHISAGHPTADGRTFADLKPGGTLDGEPIRSVRVVPYAHEHTHDILPASTTGTYFAGGVRIGSTLR